MDESSDSSNHDDIPVGPPHPTFADLIDAVHLQLNDNDLDEMDMGLFQLINPFNPSQSQSEVYNTDESDPDYNPDPLDSQPDLTSSVIRRRAEFPYERYTSARTDIERDFMHIVIKSSPEIYDTSKQNTNREAPVFCSTHEGPYGTKWAVHFYPLGHPSGYNGLGLFTPIHGDDDTKSASLYVRLQESPTDMVEARITATVVNGPEKTESIIATSIENLMLCPRNKIDEFQRGTSGHGWPKISSVRDLKTYKHGFCLVVTLQIVKPDVTFNAARQCRVFRSQHHIGAYHSPRPHLREDEKYYDAVLQASDYQWVRCHRFVLAASSEFFRDLLKEDQGIPFVHKTDNTIEQLVFMLDAMYLGKIPERNSEHSRRLWSLAAKYKLNLVTHTLFSDVFRFAHVQVDNIDPTQSIYMTSSDESFSANQDVRSFDISVQ